MLLCMLRLHPLLRSNQRPRGLPTISLFLSNVVAVAIVSQSRMGFTETTEVANNLLIDRTEKRAWLCIDVAFSVFVFGESLSDLPISKAVPYLEGAKGEEGGGRSINHKELVPPIRIWVPPKKGGTPFVSHEDGMVVPL